MQEGTAQDTREKASAVADTAKEQARTVAQDAKQEVQSVAQDAKDQARNVAQGLQTDLRERANTEATRLAQTLKQTGGQLRRMADATDEQGGMVRSLAQEGASAAERFANRLEQGGIESVLADFRSFARRNPGAFLLGAGLAGFAAGRIVRNAAGEVSLSGNGNGSASARELNLQNYAGEEPYTPDWGT
jgi:vacuolar-type H+-ATPase subunit H